MHTTFPILGQYRESLAHNLPQLDPHLYGYALLGGLIGFVGAGLAKTLGNLPQHTFFQAVAR